MGVFKSPLYAVLIVFLSLIGLFQDSSAVYTADTPYRPDPLPSYDWWQSKVKQQAASSQNQAFQGCLFGDSISSALGDPLANGMANFAMGGLSSVSLVLQLKVLNAAGIKCDQAIIAIGTNDAAYAIQNSVFVDNLMQSVELVHQMGASKITLIPAFYSTVEASMDPSLAGPISRVDEINQLIYRVAAAENLPIVADGLQPLYSNKSLKQDMTFDGVHLNNNGKQVYRQVVQSILGF
jgi:lysophospholipase L1-like esterase